MGLVHPGGDLIPRRPGYVVLVVAARRNVHKAAPRLGKDGLDAVPRPDLFKRIGVHRADIFAVDQNAQDDISCLRRDREGLILVRRDAALPSRGDAAAAGRCRPDGAAGLQRAARQGEGGGLPSFVMRVYWGAPAGVAGVMVRTKGALAASLNSSSPALAAMTLTVPTRTGVKTPAAASMRASPDAFSTR